MPTVVSRTYDLPDIGLKTYEFPTVFEDVEAFAAVAFVPHAAAARWVREPLSVVRLPGERALAMVTFQNLRRPAQMAPYLEASFAVFAKTPAGARAFHVLTMPVTSRENRARGQTIFGYPKEMSDVTIEGPSGGGRERRGQVRVGGVDLFSAQVGGGLPLSLAREVPIPSRHVQVLGEELVSVTTKVRARVRLTRGEIRTGPLFEARWPGAPRRLTAHAAVHLIDARFELHLPKPVL